MTIFSIGLKLKKENLKPLPSMNEKELQHFNFEDSVSENWPE